MALSTKFLKLLTGDSTINCNILTKNIFRDAIGIEPQLLNLPESTAPRTPLVHDENPLVGIGGQNPLIETIFNSIFLKIFLGDARLCHGI